MLILKDHPRGDTNGSSSTRNNITNPVEYSRNPSHSRFFAQNDTNTQPNIDNLNQPFQFLTSNAINHQSNTRILNQTYNNPYHSLNNDHLNQPFQSQIFNDMNHPRNIRHLNLPYHQTQNVRPSSDLLNRPELQDRIIKVRLINRVLDLLLHC